jgi:hypothetical protein
LLLLLAKAPEDSLTLLLDDGGQPHTVCTGGHRKLARATEALDVEGAQSQRAYATLELDRRASHKPLVHLQIDFTHGLYQLVAVATIPLHNQPTGWIHIHLVQECQQRVQSPLVDFEERRSSRLILDFLDSAASVVSPSIATLLLLLLALRFVDTGVFGQVQCPPHVSQTPEFQLPELKGVAIRKASEILEAHRGRSHRPPMELVGDVPGYQLWNARMGVLDVEVRTKAHYVQTH